MKEYNTKSNKNKHGKDKKAVALSYNANENAPRILAAGKGYVAEKILNTAKTNKVPVHEDETLANQLINVQIGDYIPVELYEAVSKILVFVSDMDEIKMNEDK